MTSIRNQLIASARVVIAGGVLPLDYLIEQLYFIRRARYELCDKNEPTPSPETIDLIMGSNLASNLEAVLFGYYETKFGWGALRLTEMKMMEQGVLPGFIRWTKFDICELGCAVAILTAEVGAMRPTDKEICILDWSDISLSMTLEHPEKHLLIAGVEGIK